MTILRAATVVLRLLLLVALSWFVVGIALPVPDPFAVAVAWLVLAGIVLTVPKSRAILVRWIETGQLLRPPGSRA